MTTAATIEELLSRSDARVFAFHPSGAESANLPDEFSHFGATPQHFETPLSGLSADSQSPAVVAYERARRAGHATTTVTFTGDEQQMQLDLFDLSDTYDCFLAISTPTTQAVDSEAAEPIRPRRSIYMLNVTGAIDAISPAFLEMFGWDADDCIGRSSLDFIHPDDHEAGIVAWIELLEHPEAETRVRQRFKRTDGEWIWCEVTDTNHLTSEENPHVLGEIVDISSEMAARHALQQRETLLNRLRQALPTGILHLGVTGESEVWNDRWSQLTGMAGQDGIDGLRSVLDEPTEFTEALATASESGEDVDLEVSLTGSGLCRFGVVHIRPLSEGGERFGVLVTLDDVTRLRTHQLELSAQTRHDPLTNIFNRLGIEELLQSRLEDDDVDCTVLFLDLDNFKLVNDEHGHRAGDEVLRHVARELTETLRPEDALGRIGGDEFLAILGRSTDQTTTESIVARLEAAVARIARADDKNIGVSIGLAQARLNDNIDDVLKRADQSMYETKNHRKMTSRSTGANGQLPTTDPERQNPVVDDEAAGVVPS